MDLGRLAVGTASVAIVIVYALGSARWVTTGDSWYRGLDQPSWQPPDAVFGLVWPYNFVALVVTGVTVARHASGTTQAVWIAGLVVSVAAALVWARLFYLDHALVSAAIALIVATIATIPLVVAAFATRRWLGAVLVPYQVWLVLAASLSVGYARLN